MAYRGFYKPKFPGKYRGDVNNIVYRSLLELRFMKYCDYNASVLKWSSEEFFIPYYSPADRKTRRYFPDFFIEVKKTDGSIEKILIEIKPKVQTVPPKTPKNNNRKAQSRYLKESITYVTNDAKWNAAKKVCEAKNWTFKIITEADLKIL